MGIYLSAVVGSPVTTALTPAGVPAMTLAIGIGVCDAVRAFGVTAQLKWPNDVLVGDRKIAGVLVEAQSQGSRLDSIVIGIGVDLGGPVPADVASIATTIEAETGATVERETFTAVLLANVERWVDRYVAIGLPEIIPAWLERMAPGVVARATVAGTSVTGVVAGLADDGSLLLRDDAGTLHPVRSGDVEVIRRTGAVATAQVPSDLSVEPSGACV